MHARLFPLRHFSRPDALCGPVMNGLDATVRLLSMVVKVVGGMGSNICTANPANSAGRGASASRPNGEVCLAHGGGYTSHGGSPL